MATAQVEYIWTYIAPGATVGVFLHPYSDKEVVAFSVIPSEGNRPGFIPRVELSTGPVQVHVDGIAREAWVINKSISNGGPPTPVVALTSLIERLP
jgi:hypothetical protein